MERVAASGAENGQSPQPNGFYEQTERNKVKAAGTL